jgi:YVTN family beta-propeller protein
MFVQATFDAKPEIDLNAYFILTLNADGTISVIDPIGGVKGISQLYAMPVLQGRGEDWALTADGERLFVTIPDKDRVAVIDTKRFEVVASIEAGHSPHRIVGDPDGGRLWVANDGGSGGVTVIDAATLDVIEFVPTGAGRHEIAFTGATGDGHDHSGTAAGSTDGRSLAFVSNEDDGTVSVIDAADLEVHATVQVGGRPGSLAYSLASDRVYVTGDTAGTSVVDVADHRVVDVIDTPPGVADLRFAPGGRYAFALSPAAGMVSVIDTTTATVAHTLPVAGADKVSFSQSYAYVHSSESSEVELVELAGLSKSDRLPTVRITGGQQASATGGHRVAADLIVPVAGHGGHVLIDNPADKQVYSYMEGMNAPMSSFDTYGATPQALLVVDRSIKETSPGVYRATAKIPHPGPYRVVVRVAESNVVHCFDLQTADAKDTNRQARATVQILSTEREVEVGATLLLQFEITDVSSSGDTSDVTVVLTPRSGLGNERFAAKPRPDGSYEAALQFSEPGTYLAYVTAPSLSITAADAPPITITALPPAGP